MREDLPKTTEEMWKDWCDEKRRKHGLKAPKGMTNYEAAAKFGSTLKWLGGTAVDYSTAAIAKPFVCAAGLYSAVAGTGGTTGATVDLTQDNLRRLRSEYSGVSDWVDRLPSESGRGSWGSQAGKHRDTEDSYWLTRRLPQTEEEWAEPEEDYFSGSDSEDDDDSDDSDLEEIVDDYDERVVYNEYGEPVVYDEYGEPVIIISPSRSSSRHSSHPDDRISYSQDTIYDGPNGNFYPLSHAGLSRPPLSQKMLPPASHDDRSFDDLFDSANRGRSTRRPVPVTTSKRQSRDARDSPSTDTRARSRY